jgi:hypothetical protein
MTEAEIAKNHLREHLGSLLIDPVSDGFWSIYESAKDLCVRNNQLDQILRTFQNMLTRIPEWSETTLSTEVDRIQKVSKCSYLDDLLMGVFIAYMKSFASLHYKGSSSQIKVEFDRPSLAKFIHELYKHSARKLWQVAYLFKTVGVTAEQQARNRQDIQRIIQECLEQVIRAFLPWEAITKKYFAEEPEPEQTSSAPIPPPKLSDIDLPEEEDEEDDEEEEEDDEEVEKPKLTFSDEVETIEFEDLDKHEPEQAPAPEPQPEPEDPLKELESKVADTLVLNL